MSSRKKRVYEQAQVPMSSMIDVVFLLLIYFIVTQKEEIHEAHLAVNLPAPNAAQTSDVKPKLLELEVHPGQVMLQGVPKPLGKIRETLAYLAELDPEQTVIVKTSLMARAEELVSVLDLCRGVGLTKLNVVTLQ
ncbi:MAG: biopolymer transporter ExbD [Lentisphaerae bacterium]|jgi:biopolymer transport protein ExbD|nr:biopolymer transporter ExbD [Lentisphaerota bacterium]MBT4817300.1 biopolymer transporter ExbD [Lentisphaerota bacterium]MBT5607733.1 biopolymer transporter ExbD [Lentisphaerota bacterium]MBT7054896.1 biopolymer transporter ExbD [Lentisphaerota bacterium]MBT7843334.1 biopolymer transporter ExbD [Lentisphaerota bacterium]